MYLFTGQWKNSLLMYERVSAITGEIDMLDKKKNLWFFP